MAMKYKYAKPFSFDGNTNKYIYLFSYGSNMLSSRLEDRIEIYKIIGIGFIESYQFMFHKISKDGSGKADSYFTGNNSDSVWGVVSKININDKETLDRIEGVGMGYSLKKADVNLNGRIIKCDIYVTDHVYIKDYLKPYDWYKNYVVKGAIENNLPKEYIEMIKAIPSIDDKNINRKNKNTI